MVLTFTDLAVNPFKKYLFIVCDTYEGEIRTLTDYMIKDYKLKNPRIGIVRPDTELGKTDLRAALQRLKEYKIEPVTQEILMPGAVEAGSQVMSLRRYGVNCVMNIGGITSTAIVLLRELRKLGMVIPVFHSWGVMLSEGLNEVGEVANQSYVVHAISPWYGEGPGVKNMREVTLRYFPGTEKPYRGTGFSYGWGFLAILADGLKKAGKDLDEDGLINALESFKNYDSGGILSPITFTSKSHKGGDSSRVYKADPVGGKFIAMTGWRKSE
jgi:branched-chain amino acid transport system substrate-binding protein